MEEHGEEEERKHVPASVERLRGQGSHSIEERRSKKIYSTWQIWGSTFTHIRLGLQLQLRLQKKPR
jgi:hypothetical protein